MLHRIHCLPLFCQVFSEIEVWDVFARYEKIPKEIKGRGVPVPANILTVCVIGFPAQTVIKTTAQDLYDHLNKHCPEEIEVWDVFARYQKYLKESKCAQVPRIAANAGVDFSAYLRSLQFE